MCGSGIVRSGSRLRVIIKGCACCRGPTAVPPSLYWCLAADAVFCAVLQVLVFHRGVSVAEDRGLYINQKVPSVAVAAHI